MLGGDSMVVVPVVSRSRLPRRLIKRKCTDSELISVSFKVNTYVEFPEYISRYYEQKTINNKLVYIEREKINPEVKYGFQIPIEMDAKEYYRNSCGGRKIIDLYVIEKAKNTREFNKCLQDCIRKEESNRKYNIESIITEFPEFKWKEHEYEAYYPEY